MARIRTIKPDFWSSAQIVECSPLARLLFIGIWNFADDAGIHPASAKTLKARIFPGDDIDVSSVRRLIDELSSNRLVRLYEIEGVEYLIVTGWSKHQKIERPSYKHPKPSSNPPPDGDSPPPIRRTFDDQSPPEGKGREGKGEVESSQPSAANAHQPAGVADVPPQDLLISRFDAARSLAWPSAASRGRARRDAEIAAEILGAGLTASQFGAWCQTYLADCAKRGTDVAGSMAFVRNDALAYADRVRGGRADVVALSGKRKPARQDDGWL